MTADASDTHEYEPASEHNSEAVRRHYWAVAIGLQQVDGLEVSNYVKESADTYIQGKCSLKETGDLIRKYHRISHDNTHLQADLVSQRIAEMLESGAFLLSPDFLIEIHRYLFQDLDQEIFHPGEFNRARMVKQEDILNGDSVLYADPSTYNMALNFVFSDEQTKAYTTLRGEELASFCQMISFLWQIHPFYEGNTRTVAVFSELYLNYLGFSATNEPFAAHSRYFRDSLVRATYRNAQANILPERTFLIEFYENVLGYAAHPLDHEALVCSRLFDNPHLLRNVSPDEALVPAKRD